MQEFYEQLIHRANEKLLKYNNTKMTVKRVQDRDGDYHVLFYDRPFVNKVFRNSKSLYSNVTFQTVPNNRSISNGYIYDHQVQSCEPALKL